MSLFEDFIYEDLATKFGLKAGLDYTNIGQGFALKTTGVGAQCELVPFPDIGLQGLWDMAASASVPAGGGAGSIYEITGAVAVRGGETYEAGDLAMILSDGTSSRNITTFNVNVTAAANVLISGNWDISAAANNTVPLGATNGSVYRITPGTYPHTHTSGGGAFVEVYNANDLAVVVDAAVPIVRNLTYYASLTGITSVVKGTWDMFTTSGVLPVGAAQHDIYRVTGTDYTYGGDLYKADDLVMVMTVAGPVLLNLTRGLIDDLVTSTDTTWSSDQIVSWAETAFIDDLSTSSTTRTWSVAKIVAELALKPVINDAAVSLTATWSSDKTKTYVDTHIADTSVHYVINDLAATTTTVWSSQKTNSMISAIASIINDAAGAGVTTQTWSADKLVTSLYNPYTTHSGNAAIHRSINDAGTGATDLWSASKIAAYVAASGGAAIDDGIVGLTTTWSSTKINTDLVVGHVNDATKHRSINDAATGATDLWSAAKIISYVGTAAGVSIDDGVTALGTTWSSTKINTQIDAHATDATIHLSINDVSTGATSLWSAAKIISYVAANTGASINDSVTSGTSVWSSTKVSTFVGTSVAALINDSATASGTTWSSTKVSSYVSAAVAAVDLTPLISDITTVANKTWSSTKIDAEVDARIAAIIQDGTLSSTQKTWSIDKILATVGTSVAAIINDSVTASGTTWSSTKINGSIASQVAGLINDSILTTGNAWSADRINLEIGTQVAGLINDAATVTGETWSSSKINTRIYTDFRSDIIRDNLASSSNSTWSIDKINAELAGVGGGGGGGGSGLSPWVVLTTATTLVNGGRYMLDYDAGLFDVTLPATPAMGAEIELFHIRGDVELVPTKPKVVRNGSRIEELLEDMNFNVNYASVTLVYTGVAAVGWRTK